MKSLFLIIFISFVSLAVFGIFGMHAGMQNHAGGCVAAASQGVDCPKHDSSFDYLMFHLNAYENFLAAVFSNNALDAILLSFIALIVFIDIKVLSYIFEFEKQKLLFYKRVCYLINCVQKQLFSYWFSLYENSPSYL